MDLYKIFEWTCHLSPIGNVLWTIFVAFISLCNFFALLLCMSVDMEDSGNPWWKDCLIIVGIWISPFVLLLFVSLIGYWINQ
jgi:hypothetical protein